MRDRREVASTARREERRIHLARVFGIMVEKGSELPDGDDRKKFKYRVVYQGNNVVDEYWDTAIFQDLGSSPASMEAGKMVDAYGRIPGNDLQQADAEQAYIQADLEGEETWVHLPPEAFRDTEHESKFVAPDGNMIHERPCVRLLKALYGHPDAGSCWERHCDTRAATCGFQKVPDWPSCYWHPQYKLFLMIYVDDFKLSGPQGALQVGWEMLEKAGLVLEKAQPPGLFLGCIHERLETVINGVTARGFAYDMEAYLVDTVRRYCQVVLDETGKKVNLSTKARVPTPFLPEDSKDAPSGRPLTDGPCVLCPHSLRPFQSGNKGVRRRMALEALVLIRNQEEAPYPLAAQSFPARTTSLGSRLKTSSGGL